MASVLLNLYAGPRNLSRSFSRHLRWRSVVDFARFNTLDSAVAVAFDAFVVGDDAADEEAVDEDDDVEEAEFE